MENLDLERLERICETGLRAVGYELVDLEYVRDSYGWILRIYIDHPFSAVASAAGPRPSSAICHEDCERASRQLGTTLDVEDPIEGTYRLEVSSPGLRRPLRRERDFVRFVGHRARVQMKEPLSGRKNFVGTIVEAAGGNLSLDVDGKRISLSIEGIRKANLEVEL
jgi:ribosome maturation factor RimP